MKKYGLNTQRAEQNDILQKFWLYLLINSLRLKDTYNETCLYRPPSGILLCLLELILVAKGHLDELQKAEIVSKSKLVPSVVIKTHYWINHK